MEQADRSSLRTSSTFNKGLPKTADAVQLAMADLQAQDADQRPSLASILTLKAPDTPLPVAIKRIVNIQKKHTMRGHAEDVSVLKFSPDSLHLASGSGDNSVRIWNPEFGMLETIFGAHQGKVHGLGYIGSGTILFSASKDKSIIAWDMIKVGAQRLSITGHSNVVWDVICNNDGTRLISVSHDETIRTWDTMSGALLKSTKGHTSTIYSVSLSTDGKTLATSSADKTIKLWDVETGACIKTLVGHSSHVTAVRWVPGSNSTLASSSWDETVKIWDAESGESIHTFVGHNAKVNCLTVSPDGDCIISGGEDKSVKVWKVSTLECFKTLTGHKEEVLSVAISPDGRFIASGSMDKTIIVYLTTMV